MLGTKTNSDNSITFLYNNHDAEYIAVCGSFSNWEPIYLNQGDNGWWGITTQPLSPGNYEYKFVVNGEWINDQFNFRVNNENNNSLINVGGQIGHLLKRSFYSKALGKEKKYVIYLPPSYNYETNINYSTVYLMGGLLDYEETWVRKGRLDISMDYLIGTEQIGEMIVVMPDKDEASLNEHQWDNYSYYIAEDLVNHIESEYRAIPERQHRGIEGLSLGAGWALRLIAYFPNMFKSVAIDSGFADNGTFKIFRDNLDHYNELNTRFYISCGTSEPDLINNNSQFNNFINNNGLHCENYVFDGPHDWELWEQVPRSSMMFHYYSFQ